MRYLYFILIFLISSFLFLFLNFYDNGWQLLQPFLVALLLIYFNSEQEWLYYTFALLAGFFVDSFTGAFLRESFQSSYFGANGVFASAAPNSSD